MPRTCQCPHPAARLPSRQVDADTSKYFAEISAHFKGLADGEERQLVADNALAEAAGAEARVACDAACRWGGAGVGGDGAARVD